METLGRFAPVKPGGYAEHAENWYVSKSEINEKEASIDSILLPLLESTALP